MPPRGPEPAHDAPSDSHFDSRLDIGPLAVSGSEAPEVLPGRARPLGATWDGAGTNFAVFSSIATGVELCLFDDDGNEQRVPLPERDEMVWHGYVPDVGPGQRYGYRVDGRYDPAHGGKSRASKLLLDPYAKEIRGIVQWDPACFVERVHAAEEPTQEPEPELAATGSDVEIDADELRSTHDGPDGPVDINDDDSAPFVPRSVVVDDAFDWQGDEPPRRPWSETVIYEAHVKGTTKRHPGVAEQLRGTYAGLAQPVVLDHLCALGATAVELLPVHEFVHHGHLDELDLRNYWGYDSIGFFAPHHEYAASTDAGGAVREFKEMVRELHRNGLEVILDVVYNHTGEGNHNGPTLCFRGLDNPAYYRPAPDDASKYFDYTGTGNTLNMRHPQVLQLVLDSLRYWVTEMHVDGFRFDLAVALGRGVGEFDRWSAFFATIQQDPVLHEVKLIAEPWDLGLGGYQVGAFPALWSEWNGRYRDCIRGYWRGDEGKLGELASRLSGSADVFQHDDRKPRASVNFVTVHDGFTLADLVSYNERHNEANGEDNNDGTSDNNSWNCGAEGPTEDPEIQALRARQARNMLATVMISQGVPLLLGGDEIGRTQQGNNNGYCQDNELTWLDWERVDAPLLEFAKRVIGIRRDHPSLRRTAWFADPAAVPADVAADLAPGDDSVPEHLRELAWFFPTGAEMAIENWTDPHAKSIGWFVRAADDRHLLVFLNAHFEPVPFVLPDSTWGSRWEALLDTGSPDGLPAPGFGARPAKARRGKAQPAAVTGPLVGGATIDVAARTLLVLRHVPET